MIKNSTYIERRGEVPRLIPQVTIFTGFLCVLQKCPLHTHIIFPPPPLFLHRGLFYLISCIAFSLNDISLKHVCASRKSKDKKFSFSSLSSRSWTNSSPESVVSLPPLLSYSVHKAPHHTKMVLSQNTDGFCVAKPTQFFLSWSAAFEAFFSLSFPFLGFPESPSFSWCSITFCPLLPRHCKSGPYMSSCYPRSFHEVTMSLSRASFPTYMQMIHTFICPA